MRREKDFLIFGIIEKIRQLTLMVLPSFLRVYFKSLAISSSTVVFGVMLNFSTSTFNTFGETNAGSLGPSVISFIPSLRRESNTRTAFCSYHAIL
jgi:hypothetical protein